jgi:hypothetical protein
VSGRGIIIAGLPATGLLTQSLGIGPKIRHLISIPSFALKLVLKGTHVALDHTKPFEHEDRYKVAA